jgi:hypothetical protein
MLVLDGLRTCMALACALGLGLTFAHPIAAQPGGFKTISDPSGYQYAVPAAWTLDSTTGAPGSLASSSDGGELAYVSVVPPPPSPTDESTAEVLQGVVDSPLPTDTARTTIG